MVSGDDAEFARFVRAALRGSALLPGTHMDGQRCLERRERPGSSQGAGALAVAGGCAGTALRWFGAVSRALGKCVPVLICSSPRNSAPLEERGFLTGGAGRCPGF